VEAFTNEAKQAYAYYENQKLSAYNFTMNNQDLYSTSTLDSKQRA